MNELVRLLSDSERPGRVVYGVASGDNTVAVRGSAVAVEMPALTPVRSGDYCAVWEQGADRLILGAVGRDWVSFTASWINLTVGNGTSSAEYLYAPGELRVRATFTFGSTSAITGALGLTLPNSEAIRASARESFRTFGVASLRDTGTATHLGVVQYLGSSSVAINRSVVSGANLTASTVTSTTPFTWTTGDIVLVDFTVPL